MHSQPSNGELEERRSPPRCLEHTLDGRREEALTPTVTARVRHERCTRCGLVKPLDAVFATCESTEAALGDRLRGA